MTIACLGWGSLIWDPRDLPLSGDWSPDGPKLPLEFARQSQDGRMTLVIDQHSDRVPVFWAPIGTEDHGEALALLGRREGVVSLDSIGRWPSPDSCYPFSDVIADWAVSKRISGVVWTALPPGMNGQRGVRPSLDQILAHLATLRPAARQRAAAYVERAPVQIMTPFRPALEIALNIRSA